MKYKFGEAVTAAYAEIPQVNPIRWEILFLDETNTLIPQTGKFKCKDFLNDIVSARNGHAFSIYSFNSVAYKTNDDGVWFRLTEIKDYQQFKDNVDKVINVFFDGKDEPLVTVDQIDKTTALMFMPAHIFSSTYKISLCSYLVRLCNYGEAFVNFNEALESKAAQTDRAIQDLGKKLALSWKMEVPPEYSKYWYYAGADYNSEKQPKASSGIIHNNGVLNWAQHGAK